MPFKSKKQKAYMKSKLPSVYKKFTKKYGKKIANSKKAFKQHKMYKGKMVKIAKTNAEHIRLGKLGWKHTKPK